VREREKERGRERERKGEREINKVIGMGWDEHIGSSPLPSLTRKRPQTQRTRHFERPSLQERFSMGCRGIAHTQMGQRGVRGNGEDLPSLTLSIVAR